MHIEIDLRTVPPSITLHEPDDFGAFKVVLLEAEHARVPARVVEQLAGERATSADWQHGFKNMLTYAAQHGWIDDAGVRAHIERR